MSKESLRACISSCDIILAIVMRMIMNSHSMPSMWAPVSICGGLWTTETDLSSHQKLSLSASSVVRSFLLMYSGSNRLLFTYLFQSKFLCFWNEVLTWPLMQQIMFFFHAYLTEVCLCGFDDVIWFVLKVTAAKSLFHWCRLLCLGYVIVLINI